MNKAGMGVGSASIVLVFAVLCLTIFALISFITANRTKALSTASAQMVKDYYAADTLAERVLNQIKDTELLPDSILEIDVYEKWDMGTRLISYTCPVSDSKELSVLIAFYEDSYDILKWKMQDTNQWVNEDDLGLWSGDW